MSLSTCGAITGFAFAQGTAAGLTSPASMPAQLSALDSPASPTSPGDHALRSAIVSVARHYLRMAQSRTPAEMAALIWRADSVDGVDHGPSCAAFASLTLALGAQAVGQHSWVTGGGSYPWPLHRWADVRVEPNPDSPDVVSMLQDAQAQHRWHPLGDGYRPQPGDWVLFDGHVEVVTRYAGSALYTVGADSLPDLTVNAHKFPEPFAARGVLGFVDNGELGAPPAAQPGTGQPGTGQPGTAAIPGLLAEAPGPLVGVPDGAPAYQRHSSPPAGPPPAGTPGTAAQQAFIGLVAPGAIAAQHRYGVPAAVTIAQAIEESGWGQSELAISGHNLFGIKGAGPAGSRLLPTREYENGIWVTRTAQFRVYHDVAESIEDHGQLLATGQAYQHAMAERHLPDAFATALTGVYATDPHYGASLISLMQRYDLYRYESAPPAAALPGSQAAGAQAAVPGVVAPAGSQPDANRYVPQIPQAVTTAFLAKADPPLTRAQPLYQDVASSAGIPWELLAACDWMQCQAHPRYSPVYGEKLGTANPDGTVFRTRSAALAQCAADLADLAGAVYLIDLTARRPLPVRDLARVFAAFRWGGLLRAHGVSAMEFPYSVAGLTAEHRGMRWPDIGDAPDKPGARFRLPFGAVPVVLSLGYRAVAG